MGGFLSTTLLCLQFRPTKRRPISLKEGSRISRYQLVTIGAVDVVADSLFIENLWKLGQQGLVVGRTAVPLHGSSRGLG